MKCWHCGGELETPLKILFRATCDHCSAYLHCCRNCKNYKPGMPNDCLIPGTDAILDRSAANFCEEFKLLGTSPKKNIDPKDVSRRLFGD